LTRATTSGSCAGTGFGCASAGAAGVWFWAGATAAAGAAAGLDDRLAELADGVFLEQAETAMTVSSATS
jgi:hypothetical protein